MSAKVNFLGKIFACGARTGALDAGFTAVRIAPKVLNGQMSVGEGSRLVVRNGARGAAQSVAWVSVEALAVGVVAAIGAPAMMTVAAGAGAAWAAGSLFDAIVD